jgi:hypothetical protein
MGQIGYGGGPASWERDDGGVEGADCAETDTGAVVAATSRAAAQEHDNAAEEERGTLGKVT